MMRRRSSQRPPVNLAGLSFIVCVFFIIASTVRLSGHVATVDTPPAAATMDHDEIPATAAPAQPATPGAQGLVEDRKPTRDVHVFYYPWYASQQKDGHWSHWNHRILPHWSDTQKAKYPHDVQYNPPNDIGANYYPELGAYSSKDVEVIDRHMEDLKDYVVVVSWWGPRGVEGTTDGEGYTTDETMRILLDRASAKGAKIAIHLEPYKGRTEKTVLRDLQYIQEHYGNHPALYRDHRRSDRFVVYVYDTYHTDVRDWHTILDPDGASTIRGKPYDAIMIGLLLNERDWDLVTEGGFDGVYTYFAADGFTFGSKRSNWRKLADEATQNEGLLSLSVGPGYIDTRIRPWNAENTHLRNNGDYYIAGLKTAIASRPTYLSITSYNEWHEGSQIEPAVPKTIATSLLSRPPSHEVGGISKNMFTYLDYAPKSPRYYLELTGEYAAMFVTGADI